MTELENFSLGFTYLSPVVGVYSLFALRSLPAVRRCSGGIARRYRQMFVCLVFGKLSPSFRFPAGCTVARRIVASAGRGCRWGTSGRHFPEDQADEHLADTDEQIHQNIGGPPAASAKANRLYTPTTGER